MHALLALVATLLLFPLLCFAQSTQPALSSQPTWQALPQGQLILRPFASAPYPHPSRDAGYKNSAGKEFPREGHYDDSTIGIFIPANFKPADEVDYVVYFHGHSHHVSDLFPKYKLPEELAAAKVNAILLVPQGPKDAPDSGGGKLELDQGAFSRLIAEVTRYLNDEKKIRTKKVGRIVLSAHSGGYKVTAAILNHGGMGRQISDVLLLDASYGELPIFAAWCKNDPDHRLVSLFTDHLADENQQLMTMLDGAKVPYQKLDEMNVTDEKFAVRGPSFMHTKGPHDQVPVDYFGRLVKTSALAGGKSAASR